MSFNLGVEKKTLGVSVTDSKLKQNVNGLFHNLSCTGLSFTHHEFMKTNKLPS